MAFGAILTNIYLWIILTFVFLLLFGLMIILLIILAKKTHAIIEFKAWIKGKPIALFFRDDRYCEWKAVDNEAGIVEDKAYGSFIISASYVDKTTKNILLPFDSKVGASIDIKAAKLADDLKYIIKSPDELRTFRIGIANNAFDENDSINSVKTSVDFGSIKNMMTALTPHNISAKIEKVIAARMKNFGGMNVNQAILIFVSIFGAIGLGALILHSVLQ